MPSSKVSDCTSMIVSPTTEKMTPPDNENNGILLIDNQTKKKPFISNKLIFATTLLLSISLLVYDSLTTKHVDGFIKDILEWVEVNPLAGMFVISGVYIVATILFIPGSLLTIGSGFVFASASGLGWGVLLGSLSVFIGASLGSICSFLAGRYLLRDFVNSLSKKYPKLQALDKAMKSNGFRIMCMLRMSPLIPFNALNYGAGGTGLPLKDFCTSLFAMIPGVVLFTYLGATASSLTAAEDEGDGGMMMEDCKDQNVRIIVLAFGLVFGMAGVAATGFYAKKELALILKHEEEEKKKTVGDEEESNTSVA